MEDALDLWILDAGVASTAIVCARAGNDLAIGKLVFDKRFHDLCAFRDRIHATLRGDQIERPTRDEMTEFGNNLFDFVLEGDLLRMYNNLKSDAYVRLHV